MKTLLIAAAALSIGTAAIGTAAAQQDALTQLPAGDYVMDKTHGYVTFSYSHLGFSNPILSFNDIDATVDLVPSDLDASSLSVTIDPASIDSAVPKFDEHLVGSDYFDVETHDEITFTSTDITIEDDASGTLTGDLTIKGITKPVTLDVTLNKAGLHPLNGKPTFGISATGTVDRTAFDLGAYAPAVGAEVSLRIEAEFSKQ